MTDDTVDTDTPASEQFDLSFGTDLSLTIGDIAGPADDLERVPDAADPDDYSDEGLAELIAALKRLENAAEDARDHLEDALDDRTEPGDRVGDIQRIEGKNSYVTDAEGAFAAVADAGEDPLDVASVKIGDLRDVLGRRADEYLGSSSYSYWRRQT